MDALVFLVHHFIVGCVWGIALVIAGFIGMTIWHLIFK